MRSLLLGVALLFSVGNSAILWTCKWKAPNATYDLCPYQLTSDSQIPYFTVWDNDTIANVRNFSYLFNVAANLVAAPDVDTCMNLTLRAQYNYPVGYCRNLSTANPTCAGFITPITTLAGGYQTAHGHSTPGCYRLHDGETQPAFSFLDSTDPSSGVAVTYSNGDYCPKYTNNRQLQLQFVCDPRVNNYPDKEESVSEDGCMYTIRIRSAIGCPVECPIVKDALCSGYGICEFDYTSNKPRCFCYSGRYGDDCSIDQDPDAKTDVKTDDSGYVAGLIVVIILLVLTIGILAYLFRKLQRMFTSPNAAISNLKGKKHKQIVDDDSDDGMLDDGVNKL